MSGHKPLCKMTQHTWQDFVPALQQRNRHVDECLLSVSEGSGQECSMFKVVANRGCKVQCHPQRQGVGSDGPAMNDLTLGQQTGTELLWILSPLGTINSAANRSR
jgi:hypothetical protein